MSYKRKTFPGGAHIADYKGFTNTLETVVAEAPAKVYIPMSMHIGAPSKPLVEIGEEVKMGQKVAESQSFVSVPAHASVSGKVTSIQPVPIPSGRLVETIVIENDFNDDWLTPPYRLSKAEIDALDSNAIRVKVQEAGVVGMGGAAFPTHVKDVAPSDKEIDCVIINGIECEPFVTADHRIMLERPERILDGIRYFLRMLNCEKAVIAIEENKINAFDLMLKLTEKETQIEAVICKEKYPQGSEKQLIKAITGREVPPGGLPSDVGVLVHNVATAAAVSDAIEYGRPLIDRIVTLNGNGVAKPMNYRVRIGTLYTDLITQNGGIVGETVKIIAGGPMMGFTVYSLDIPVTKGTSGILIFNEDSQVLTREAELPCVRCARCVDHCPMRLEPTTLMKAAKKGNWERAKDYSVTSCMECGCCSYVCPSMIPLVQYIRLAKQYVTSKNGMGAVNPLLL
ncbi:MAG: electron transport complex subunit RsxC [Peptococcaceae bacterium]|jgi:electron transport complex protein RnfC|nr:electron transport complex subunit RsxC [Peptococcaceae bacterium]